MSPAAYNQHYKKPDLFGEPLRCLISFFSDLSPVCVWDLGAGQGRNTLPLMATGHSVVAIDLSDVGLRQIREKQSDSIQGKLETRCADIYGLRVEPGCDVILLDSMFHFYKNDREREIALLTRLSSELKSGGILCLALIATATADRTILHLRRDLWTDWSVLLDELEMHAATKSRYRILAIRKPVTGS